MDRRFFVAVSIAAFVTCASSACGLISGVSDDYTYDGGTDAAAVDAAAVDGAVKLDASLTPDASSPDSGPVEAGVCPGALPKASNVSERCQSCMVMSCCSQMQRCTNAAADTVKCSDFLKCIDSCAQAVVGDPCRIDCAGKAGIMAGVVVNELLTCARQSKCMPDKCYK